jgi:hypothetical protein
MAVEEIIQGQVAIPVCEGTEHFPVGAFLSSKNLSPLQLYAILAERAT